MASDLTVQTIRGPGSGANANKIIIPAGQTLDASNGFVPPAGYVKNFTTQSIQTYTATSTNNSWINVWSYNVNKIYSNTKLIMQLSILDLIEASNFEYFRVLNASSIIIGNTWGRQTNGNGGWRGILPAATIEDNNANIGNNTYTLQFYGTSGTIYVNYNSTTGPYTMASYINIWEIAQ